MTSDVGSAAVIPIAHPRRYDRLRRLEQLDPATDYERIFRATATLEFPWDINQALSFALFRTYAVPSIGRLLARTGELVDRTQKRYDDTSLLLDAILEHGFDSAQATEAIRRVNQMHGAYPISDDDMRYVLSTFVASPIRWVDRYGWRPLAEVEKVALANYHRELGRRMAIPDLPATYADFVRHHDAYERANFGYDPGSRAVADATVRLFCTFPPNHRLPPAAVTRFSYALMDEALVESFGFPRPHPLVRAAAQGSLVARGLALRLAPPRREPKFARHLPNIRSYPQGYELRELGTFPTGVPRR